MCILGMYLFIDIGILALVCAQPFPLLACRAGLVPYAVNPWVPRLLPLCYCSPRHGGLGGAFVASPCSQQAGQGTCAGAPRRSSQPSYQTSLVDGSQCDPAQMVAVRLWQMGLGDGGQVRIVRP